MPYYPSARSGDRISDLLMQQGQIQAQGAERSGNLWANTLSGLGQQLGGAIAQYGEQKALKKRDAAWVGFIEDGGWQKDPRVALAGSMKIWGPEKGPQMAQGLEAFQRLQQTKGADALAQLPKLATAMDAMSPELRAMLYPRLRESAVKAVPELGQSLPEQFDEKAWPELSKAARAFGEQPKQPGTREIKVRNADGSESIQIVADKPGQTFESAAAPGPKHMVTVPGPNGPVQRLATEEELAKGVTAYRAPTQPSKERIWVNRGGNLIRISESEYKPGDLPANTREQGRPVTSGDAKKVAEFDTSLDDLNALTGGLSESGATGVSAKVGAALPNFITEWTGAGSDAKKKQALIDRVKQVIGKALEGGVLRKEDETKYEKILPTVGDPPDLVQSKIDGLFDSITERRQTTLDSLADAGYDVTKFAARAPRARVTPAKAGGALPLVSSPEEARRLPKGTLFRTPDGRTLRVP
jgi:hypothetical protein